MSEMSTEELEQEAQRLASLRSPTTLAHHLDPDHFQIRAHTRVIGDALAGLGRDYDRLLIVTPPQIGKSTAAAVWAPFWWLIQQPSDPIIIGSYGATLATKHSRGVRRLVRDYGAAYGLAMDRATSAADEWYTTAGGGVKAVGVGGGATGFPARKMVVDDPFKNRAEANSKRARETAWEWWSSSLISRLAPRTPVCLVNTAWHPDDLRGRLLKMEGRADEGGAWHVVHLPAIADLRLTRNGDPLGRRTGEPLTHPDIEDLDTAELREHWEGKKARSSAQDWAALYQGDPQPKGSALLSEQKIRERTHIFGLPPAMKSAVTVDPSGGGRDSCGIIGGFLGTDMRCYVTHDRTAVMPSTEWPRAACRLAAEIDADRIALEKNFGGDMPTTLVRTAWKALRTEWDEEHADALAAGTVAAGDNPYRRLAPRVTWVRAKRNKLLRADPIAQQVIEDRMRFGAHLPDLFKTWQTWQPTDPDSPGELDACVYLGYELLPVPGAQDVITKEDDAPVRIDDVRPTGWASQRID